VHAGGDAAGAEVHRALTAALRAAAVEVLTRAVALDALIDEHGSAAGLLAATVGADDRTLHPGLVTARAVVLATGGFGQAFATTTSPPGVTGDGLALAARAGARLRDVEFVQFHPTVLWQEAASGQCPLITEALRGAGAVLVDAAGRPVMAGRHPRGDLAPRDVVSALMQQRMGHDGDHLWLDATALGRAALERDFPTVTAACRARGIDPVTEPIPVAPGAHYACGGILADMDGRTSVPGLFAVGEVACTGVHGANRLASNSVTEALIAGRRAGRLLGRDLAARSASGHPGSAAFRAGPTSGHPGPAAFRAGAAAAETGLDAGVSPAARPALARAMSRRAGVLRDRDGLDQLLDTLDQAPPAVGALDLATAEATSLHTVSVLLAVSALTRAESRGCHRWRDVPAVSDEPGRHTILHVDDGQVVVAGAVTAGVGA
jgi:L-aspartate oxidase